MVVPLSEAAQRARMPNTHLVSLSEPDLDSIRENGGIFGVEQSTLGLDVSGLIAALYSFTAEHLHVNLPLKVSSKPNWTKRDVVANYAAIHSSGKPAKGSIHLSLGDDSVDAYVQVPWFSRLRDTPQALFDKQLGLLKFPFSEHLDVESLSPVEDLMWPVVGGDWVKRYGPVTTGRFRVYGEGRGIQSRHLLRQTGAKVFEYFRLQEHAAARPHETMTLCLDFSPYKGFEVRLSTDYGGTRQIANGFILESGVVDVHYLGIAEDKGRPQFRYSALTEGLGGFLGNER